MHHKRFSFLVLEEHPYGREMLRILLDNDLFPDQIIEEISSIAEIERDKFAQRIDGQPMPPTISQQLVGTGIPVYYVQNHNDPECKRLLIEHASDLTVLGGTRIIKPEILETAHLGTINAHPGLLPWLRGSASVGWALYKDMPIGSTVHFIDPGIDTGDIIKRQELAVVRGDTYESINARIATLSGELMGYAIKCIRSGYCPRIPQEQNLGETYRVIPDELLEIGKSRLREGTYSHFV